MKSRRDTWKPGQVRYDIRSNRTGELENRINARQWWVLVLDEPGEYNDSCWSIWSDSRVTDLVGDGHGR